MTDDAGASNTNSQQVSVTAPPGSISLAGSTSSFWCFIQVILEWDGANGDNVDIYENGSILTTTLMMALGHNGAVET